MYNLLESDMDSAKTTTGQDNAECFKSKQCVIVLMIVSSVSLLAAGIPMVVVGSMTFYDLEHSSAYSSKTSKRCNTKL